MRRTEVLQGISGPSINKFRPFGAENTKCGADYGLPLLFSAFSAYCGYGAPGVVLPALPSICSSSLPHMRDMISLSSLDSIMAKA